MKMKRLSSAFFALCILSAMSAFAEGQQEVKFPEREIEIMVPWAAGGATDVTFRVFSGVIQKYLEIGRGSWRGSV